MKKLVILASLALLAAGSGPNAKAQEVCTEDLLAMQCVWTFRGDYIVKGYDSTDPSVVIGRGELCSTEIADLESSDWEIDRFGRFPTSNAMGDTYLLRRSCEDL
jgi:hypothetical protein